VQQADQASANRPFPGPQRSPVPSEALPQAASGAAAATPGSSIDTPDAPAAEPVGLSIFRNTVIPATGISGGYANISPRAHEPSTDANGKNIFQTGNWYASYSKNNGATWTALNPFSIFGTGFCCDQVTIYDSARNRQFWVLQYNNRLVVANSAGTDLVNWCFYSFTPQNIGSAAGNVFDYNDLALGTRFLYLSSNIFNSAGSFVESSVLRLPLSEMITCTGFNYNFIRRTTEFTYKVAAGGGDIARIASNNLDVGTGTTLRIFTWPENSTSFTTSNVGVSAFTYESRNSGQNCGSTDNTVRNWCQFADSRVLGGAQGGGVLAFSWNVRQSGTARPHPYTRLTILNATTLAVVANYDIWSATYSFHYSTLAVNDNGHVGILSTWGGGTASTNNKFPSPIIFIRDDVNPAPGFTGPEVVAGAGNACLSGTFFRWGDYQTARAVDTADGVFVASTYHMANSSCTSGSSIPRNIAFGRARSQPGYDRWKNL